MGHLVLSLKKIPFFKFYFFADHPQDSTILLIRRNKMKILQKHSAAAFVKNYQVPIKVLANIRDDKTQHFTKGTSEVHRFSMLHSTYACG